MNRTYNLVGIGFKKKVYMVLNHCPTHVHTNKQSNDLNVFTQKLPTTGPNLQTSLKLKIISFTPDVIQIFVYCKLLERRG